MKEKFLLLVLFLGSVLLFALLDMKKAKRHNFMSRADHIFPFSVWFVIPYIGLFPFIIGTALALFHTSLVSEYFLSMSIAMYTAAMVWWLVPAGTLRPHLKGEKRLERMVMWIYKHDARRNAFPSSHVFTSLLSSFYLASAYPALALLWWSVGGLIAISTLFMKQHYLVDVIAGTLWVMSSVFLAQVLLALVG